MVRSQHIIRSWHSQTVLCNCRELAAGRLDVDQKFIVPVLIGEYVETADHGEITAALL